MSDAPEQQPALLARLDERTKNIELTINSIQENVKSLASHYVTKEEFAPVKSVVFGLVGIVLTAVIGGLVAILINR